ncbi:thioester domain-containing protein [Streptomonospora wellingtoniae]|uniref:Thioester domain-containing protein n=1 Tax=Streptomonospora wellingtoniae TaxID=3075544 RepID=A0ABU2KSY6_9ACTN|nr:thioester domain-containing protein [Streptomonospora sp. DSM 45055]MDT0302404.1 thioester domain-containing protein [Streptomonospora sp. DSM 45055]
MPGLMRRWLAAAAAALAFAGGSAVPASAENLSRVAPEAEQGATIRLAGGGAAETALYRMMTGDDAGFAAYCADISTSVDPQAAYAEAGWGAGAAPKAAPTAPGAVSWITAHSYPNVGLERLREASGVPEASRAQAIAATQAAVWHHTNGVALERERRGDSGRLPPTVRLYDYLVEGARREGGSGPGATLELTPDRVEGADPDEAIGPLTVHTSSPGPVRVWVSGTREGRLTGADGEPVEQVADGDEFFLQLPPETPTGVATVYAEVTDARVRPGRLFMGKDGVQTQPLVVAETAVTGATAAVKVDWTGGAPPPGAPLPPAPSAPGSAGAEAGAAAAPSPSSPALPTAAPSATYGEVVVAEDRRPDDDLARTGTWLGGLLALGLSLAAIGGAVLYLTRHRRSM